MKRSIFVLCVSATALLALVLASPAYAQQRDRSQIKNKLVPEDYDYEMPEGVTTKEITFYSDGVACWGMIFFPEGFTAEDKRPGIVLGHGWTGTHVSLEQYAARFAERGLIAMAIDYRGWGKSGGFVELAEPDKTGDDVRHTTLTAKVRIKRTRLLPLKQVEDYRNAISFLQGEPGVDADRIGIWGSSYSGGHVVVVAAMDARVKAAVGQVPAVSGKNAPRTPRPMPARLHADALSRARTGKGGEYKTGFSTPRMIDVETQWASSEYHPYHYLERVPETTAILFIGAGDEELYGPRKNKDRGEAAAKALKGPSKYVEVPGITHFEMYVDENFETSSNLAADWFVKYLGEEK